LNENVFCPFLETLNGLGEKENDEAEVEEGFSLCWRGSLVVENVPLYSPSQEGEQYHPCSD